MAQSAEFRHATHCPSGSAQRGVSPLHWTLSRHCTHAPAERWQWSPPNAIVQSSSSSQLPHVPARLHETSVPEQSVSTVQLVRHLFVCRSQICPEAQLTVALQATQLWLAAEQAGRAAGHCWSEMHSTHCPEDARQCSDGSPQSWSTLHFPSVAAVPPAPALPPTTVVPPSPAEPPSLVGTSNAKLPS